VADEKKGSKAARDIGGVAAGNVIRTAIENFKKFVGLGKKKDKKPRVDTGKVSSRPVRPEPNEQQKAAVAKARRRVKDGT